jgi:hypothetical protein
LIGSSQHLRLESGAVHKPDGPEEIFGIFRQPKPVPAQTCRFFPPELISPDRQLIDIVEVAAVADLRGKLEADIADYSAIKERARLLLHAMDADLDMAIELVALN